MRRAAMRGCQPSEIPSPANTSIAGAASAKQAAAPPQRACHLSPPARHLSAHTHPVVHRHHEKGCSRHQKRHKQVQAEPDPAGWQAGRESRESRRERG